MCNEKRLHQQTRDVQLRLLGQVLWDCCTFCFSVHMLQTLCVRVKNITY